MSFFNQRAIDPTKEGTFELDAPNVKHSKLGVWDLYEEIHPKLTRVPWSSAISKRLQTYHEMLQSFPFVWRMIKDVLGLKSCRYLLVLYLFCEAVTSITPAARLYFSGQMLDIVRIALEERRVDRNAVIYVVLGRLACGVINQMAQHGKMTIGIPLNTQVGQLYSVQNFYAKARLDCPTFDDPAVQRHLNQTGQQDGAFNTSVAWSCLGSVITAAGIFLQMISQSFVLFAVVRNQQDGLILASLAFSHSLYRWLVDHKGAMKAMGYGGVWAATTKNDDYIRMKGLEKTINETSHRKEMVAGGNTWQYMFNEYRNIVRTLGLSAKDFNSSFRERGTNERWNVTSYLGDAFAELPRIVFAYRAIQYPASIPVSLASLNLISDSAESFSFRLFMFLDRSGSLGEQFTKVKRMYEVTSIPNLIEDGRISYPENMNEVRMGMSVEFRNVSFKYPGSENYALRDISFTVQKGQLCVIVGVNGSGKSTILKLIARVYDPTEGEIFIDGVDLKTLRMEDVRRTMSVLFQDYTIFPLSIRENIGIGDPAHAKDMDKIHEAAQLGGAEDFVNKLPEKFDSYLDRPVQDHYSGLPVGTTSLFGRKIEYKGIRGVAKMNDTTASNLSGGQLQRIALSRTFMRSLVSEPSQEVGLLLFDEPSSSLDPKLEYDLFERLRQLRGNKTMIFSSHRFGNLTRHADLILYMDDSKVVEMGTHTELLAKDGEYARIWNISAQAFL